jgi:hypothetical protein
MSCRNPDTEISAEISKTLETLGPKIKISWNFILRASKDALEEFVLLCAKSSPSFQVLRVESPPKGRWYEILWKP